MYVGRSELPNSINTYCLWVWVGITPATLAHISQLGCQELACDTCVDIGDAKDNTVHMPFVGTSPY